MTSTNVEKESRPGVCPSCGAAAAGKFCAECGASLHGATCGECAAPLTPGARFCHRCGTPAGSGGTLGSMTFARALPWAVAGIALLALVALVAGQNFANRRGSSLDGPQNALPQAGLDDRGQNPVDPNPGSSSTAGRPPDISTMTPRDRADRLFERVMRLSEQNKIDSVQFFAPMAIGAYQQLDSLTSDERFHLGMIALATKFDQLNPIARAEADTILKRDSKNLLGLILASRVAGALKDSKAQSTYEKELVAAAPAELAKNKPEYEQHRPYIDAAVKAARK